MELHLFAVTDKNRLWHSIGHGGGSWDNLGDVNHQVGLLEADRTVVDAACTTDSSGNLHVLVLVDNNGLWYTVRDKASGNWRRPLEELRRPPGPAANLRKITAVGAGTDGMALIALAATEDQKLHRAVRKPDGPDILKGKWETPFQQIQIKPEPGTPTAPTAPPTTPFTVLVGAS